MTSEESTRFFPVAVGTLRLDAVTDFDLYIRSIKGKPPVLYRGKGLAFDAEALQRLAQRGVGVVYVASEDEDEYRRYLEKHLGEIVADPTMPIDEKCEILYSASKTVMKEVMADPRARDVVNRCQNVVESTYDFLRSERSAFTHLLKITSFDYYTYTHSVNVFVFGLALARECLDADEQTLKDFGSGALLHDIGKSQLDASIINAKGKLTDEQWRLMKQHPSMGAKLLEEHGSLPPVAMDVVLHHHEKMNGAGYPEGLGDGKLSPYARICCICDIFDALTTKRSYKDALKSFPALQLMRDEMGGQLDPDIFRTFVKMLAQGQGSISSVG